MINYFFALRNGFLGSSGFFRYSSAQLTVLFLELLNFLEEAIRIILRTIRAKVKGNKILSRDVKKIKARDSAAQTAEIMPYFSIVSFTASLALLLVSLFSISQLRIFLHISINNICLISQQTCMKF